jgi:hypothetical protein
MANTKPIGVAFADPVLESGTEISEAAKAENDLFSDFVAQHQGGTIATTGNSDTFIIAPYSGVVSSAIFSGVDALAANNTNYITFSITNLGQAGAGSAALLAATAVNTTQVTGGSALVANARRDLTLTGTAASLVVVKGDRLRMRAAATGTLANTVVAPVYALTFTPA